MRKRMQEFFVIIAGCVMLIVVFTNALTNFNRRWTFGRLWMPHTLLDESGTRYIDGSVIDSFSLGLARSGFEQEFFLIALSIFAMCTVWLAGQALRLEKLHRQNTRGALELAAYYAKRRAENAARRDRGEHIDVPLTKDRPKARPIGY